MNFDDRDEMTVLAGEYVLGLLSPQEESEFERELAHNAVLARAVGGWRDRLLTLAPPSESVAPAANLWARIEHDLPRSAPVRAAEKGFWNSLVFWRLSGLTGMAAAILLAWNIFYIRPTPFTPNYVAVLQAPNVKQPGWLVEIDAGNAVRLTPLTRPVVAVNQALQFWTKPEGAAGPTSLGLVRPDRPTIIPAFKLPGIGPNQLFEVTLEPEAGSPIGRPTGPILAVGNAIRL